MSLSAKEIELERASQTATFIDSCLLYLRREGERDRYNRLVPQWVKVAVACAFSYRTGQYATREVQGDSAVPVADAILRLPVDVGVTSADRVRLTHRAGEALSEPLDFEVVGEPQRGITATILSLKSVARA